MNFNDMLSVWAKLKGQTLRSIRRGADIRIVDVDHEHSRVIVEGKSGKKSRSFPELERVWKALTQHKTVHVDSVLGGSGSSRNQPETLFANLPFVEWLLIDQKKHLLLKDEATHAAGTLREVDSIAAALIRTGAVDRLAPSEVEIVLPVSDIKAVSKVLRELTGVEGQPESPGEYVYQLGSVAVRVVRETSVDERFRGRSILRARGLHAVTGSTMAQAAGRQGQATDVSDQLVVLDEDR